METPICDFVRRYAESESLRLHMPGHKGRGPLGLEHLDITEIVGADSLFEADGIIRESEKNASCLFGCRTFYSTEGSSLCIRAMMYLALLDARKKGKRPLILAGRNAHRTFISAAAMLDFDVEWLRDKSYISCDITPSELELSLKTLRPTAVYITSPDYLGNTADIAALSEVCHRYGVLLFVDNAHGAYLKFMPQSQHPIDLGADVCCDSAHKTLPVLTGGAYLHISPGAPHWMSDRAKDALALFASTSPSYLILQSLDAANSYLADHHARLFEFISRVMDLKSHLCERGWTLFGDEVLKLTLCPKSHGYTGISLANILADAGIVCEFADPDFLVLMLTPEIEHGLPRLRDVLDSIKRREPISDAPPPLPVAEQVISIREAVLSSAETVPISESEGRILALSGVGCPPAIPIVVCGERIDREAIRCFEYYGIDRCTVVTQ